MITNNKVTYACPRQLKHPVYILKFSLFIEKTLSSAGLKEKLTSVTKFHEHGTKEGRNLNNLQKNYILSEGLKKQLREGNLNMLENEADPQTIMYVCMSMHCNEIVLLFFVKVFIHTTINS